MTPCARRVLRVLLEAALLIPGALLFGGAFVLLFSLLIDFVNRLLGQGFGW